jgi:hypothetical protein
MGPFLKKECFQELLNSDWQKTLCVQLLWLNIQEIISYVIYNGWNESDEIKENRF